MIETHDAILVGGSFIDPNRVRQPLGMSYIASYARGKGKNILLINPCQYSWDPISTAKALSHYSFNVLGISIHCEETNELEEFMEMAKMVHEQDPNIFICIGGFGIASIYKTILKKWHFINCVMLGEAELRFYELLNKVQDGKSWKDIDAIAYVDDDEIILTRCPAPSINLSEIPAPATDFIEKAFEIESQPFFRYEIISKRGCNYQCSFCSIIRNQALYGHPGVRYRKIKDVVGEIKDVYNRFKIDRFRFWDEFFVGRDKKGRVYAEELCEKIISLPFKIRFAAETRADSLDNSIIRMLKKAGCKRIYLGIESFYQRDLNLYQKNMKVKTLIECIEMLMENGYNFSRDSDHRIAAGMIIWNPYSDKESLRANAKYCRKYGMPPKKLMDRLNIWRETKLWHKIKDDGILRDSNTYFKDPIVQYAYDVLKEYFSSDIYLTRERIRAVEKIVLWENSKKDSRFDSLKYIRTHLDDSAYDLFEELVNSFDCKDISVKSIFYEHFKDIKSRCIQIINKYHCYENLKSIIEERGLSYKKLNDVNIRVQF